MNHGHHKISAAIFVGSLILGCALILAAELTKPPRYEYHPATGTNAYVIFDNDTGRAAVVDSNAKSPAEQLSK